MNRLSAYIIIAAATVLAFASCEKQEAAETGCKPVVFSFDETLNGFSTKSAITDENIASNIVKAYARRNSVVISNMNPATLRQNQTTKFWTPSNLVYWNDGSYMFNIYAYTENGITNVSNDGFEFTVTQPTSYTSPSSMADYVTSGEITVTPEQSAKHPLIVAELNHVLPAVEVYAIKAESLKNRTVVVTDITLSGLYYSADMEWNDASEAWIPSWKGENTASYSVTGEMTLTGERTTTPAKMQIITVPQNLTEKTLISVTYKVDEALSGTPSYKEYTEAFEISSYFASVGRDAAFTPGHRTVFFLAVDTGIHLSASITPWKQVDFIEGTVLPTIK